MVKKTEVEYSSVNITDYDLSDDLTTGAKVIAFKDIRPQSIRDYAAVCSQGVHRSKYFPAAMRLAEICKNKKSLTSPKNGTIVFNNEPFVLSMYSTSPCIEHGAWELLSKNSVNVKPFERRVKVTDPIKRVLQRFAVELEADFGYIQFQCAASQLNHHGQKCIAGDLLNVFILKDERSVSAIGHYPPVVPVIPETKQTWVPLKVGQTLQLMLPFNSKVTTSTGTESIRLVKMAPSENMRYECFHYNCVNPRRYLEAIWFTMPDKTRGVVVLPGFEQSKEGNNVPVIQSPSDQTSIYCNGYERFIFRTAQSLSAEDNWLDRSFRLRLECAGKWQNEITREPYWESEVTVMGKPQLYIKLINLYNRNVCQAI